MRSLNQCAQCAHGVSESVVPHRSILRLLLGLQVSSTGCGRWRRGCFRARGEAGGCDEELNH